MVAAYTTAVAGIHTLPFSACVPEGSSQKQSFSVAGFDQTPSNYGLGMPTYIDPSATVSASGSMVKSVFQTDMDTQKHQNFDVDGRVQTIFSPGALDVLLKVPGLFQFGPDPLHAHEFDRHIGREDITPWPEHHYGETTRDVMDTQSASSGLLPDGFEFAKQYETQFLDGMTSAQDVFSDQNDGSGEQSGHTQVLPNNDDTQTRAHEQMYPQLKAERSLSRMFRETLENMHSSEAQDAQVRLDAEWQFGLVSGAGDSEDEACEDTCRPLYDASSAPSHLPRAVKALSTLTRANTAQKPRNNVTATRDPIGSFLSVQRESVKSVSKRRAPQRSKARPMGQSVESITKQGSDLYKTGTPCIQIELRTPTPSYVDQPPKGPKLVWKCPHDHCDHASRRLIDAKQHVLAHSSITLACPGCLHDYSRIDPLKRHAKTHQERPKLQNSSCATQNAPWTDKVAWNEATFLDRATFVEARPLERILRVVCVKWI